MQNWRCRRIPDVEEFLQVSKFPWTYSSSRMRQPNYTDTGETRFEGLGTINSLKTKSPRTRELRLYLIAPFRCQCWIPTGEDDKSYRNNLLAGALQSIDNLRRLKKKQTRRFYFLRLEKNRKKLRLKEKNSNARMRQREYRCSALV
jgi:hypothetical protein